jgi:hypothetical protein
VQFRQAGVRGGHRTVGFGAIPVKPKLADMPLDIELTFWALAVRPNITVKPTPTLAMAVSVPSTRFAPSDATCLGR